MRAVKPRTVRLSPWAPPSPAAMLMPATLRSVSRSVVAPWSCDDVLGDDIDGVRSIDQRLSEFRQRNLQTGVGDIDRGRHALDFQHHGVRAGQVIADAGAGKKLLQGPLRRVQTGHSGRPDASHRLFRHGHTELRRFLKGREYRVQGPRRNVVTADGQTLGLAGRVYCGRRPVLLGINLEYGIAAEGGVGCHGPYRHPVPGPAAAVTGCLLVLSILILVWLIRPQAWFEPV